MGPENRNPEIMITLLINHASAQATMRKDTRTFVLDEQQQTQIHRNAKRHNQRYNRYFDNLRITRVISFLDVITSIVIGLGRFQAPLVLGKTAGAAGLAPEITF